MNYLALSFLVVLCISTASSLKCYQCSSSDGNCEKDGNDCPLSALNRCLKLKVGDAVTKSCSTEALCDLMKFCDNKDDCTATCCSDDLCNASSTVTPAIVVTVVATLMAIAGFLL